jgi:hypothetical protein
MPGTGPDGHDITLAQARELTRRFRENNGNNPNTVRSHRIAREVIDRILAQAGCAGLRIYHGRQAAPDERGGPETLVVVGVTAADDDLTAVIAEETWKCPPACATGTTVETGS